ncbi:MAG: hypothetical protein HC906_10270 [Bacteroidales bacterium]|nr:hypothetical protein [Bacteroidales bacterium]
MRLILILLFGIMFIAPATSQNYTRDAGFRFGSFPSFSYRQFEDETSAFELMISGSWRKIRFTVLREYFSPAFMQFSDNISFVYGYGAHVGMMYSNEYKLLFRTYQLDEWKLSPGFGLDALLGFEYNLGDLPIVIGMDFKPFFEFSTTRIFYIFLDDASFSLKYKF